MIFQLLTNHLVLKHPLRHEIFKSVLIFKKEAEKAIQSAYVESHCAEYGVGLVRLMGRHAGFIAMEASSASRDVNVCLVPEFKFEIYGPKGLLEYITKRVQVRKHCVVVVAEGAGTYFFLNFS